MKRSITVLIFTLFASFGVRAGLPAKSDRWLEIDLYWFNKADMEKSADEFWSRYHPLFDNIEGWRGVILNVGWIADYILEWQGDLNQDIRLPKNMIQSPVFMEEGQLTGSTQERMNLWRNRFENAGKAQEITYDRWTYLDLKKLARAIKTVARSKYNLKDIKVGTLVLGWESIYEGDKSSFAKKHPNTYRNNAPNFIALLTADHSRYGAFPQGIPDNTPLTAFFGKQWGDLSKSVGLDAIILRDSFLGVGVYGRRGPFGKTASDDPDKVSEWSMATADLVRQTKLSNPAALVIGYSSAASAVADWRVNCFDLESIAKEGWLDGWIDQTWAGAWNEVGQRPETFWNNQTLGWTYQLAYMLLHGAVLADSKVHHYFLTETFDAWESWDIIHNGSDRLRWGIWAYSHAGIVKPDGLKMPAGNYISWCNQGKRLLSEEDVRFLSGTLDSAVTDASETRKISGPTLVYCRSAMEWQSKNRPEQSIGEWIDEQAGTIAKWSVPILSATRVEYLPGVESDMFVFQTPVHLKASEKQGVVKILTTGKPCAIFASPAGGIDREIAGLAGITSNDTIVKQIRFIGTINYRSDGIFSSLPNTFPVFQPFTRNRAGKDATPVYSVAGSPCLVISRSPGRQVIFWDPPEFSKNLPADSGEYGESLDQILGSPVPYALTARLFNQILKANNLISVDSIQLYHPVSLAVWQLRDGRIRILTGNLEEGINHSPDLSARTVLNLPDLLQYKKSYAIDEEWSGMKVITSQESVKIELDQGESKLFTVAGKPIADELITSQKGSQFRWPEGKNMALSLTFDDARLSQVDKGIPLLDKYRVKATFYISPDNLLERKDLWKEASRKGHDIGNHTVLHPCTGNFEWSRDKALENYTLESMASELDSASRFINDITGIRPVSFAYPCGQTFVGRGNTTKSYVPLIADMFETGRGWLNEGPNDPVFCDLAQLSGMELDGKSFDQIKALIESTRKTGGWLILAGHEMNTGGFQTSILQTIEEICRYAANPADSIWIGNVREIGEYLKAERAGIKPVVDK